MAKKKKQEEPADEAGTPEKKGLLKNKKLLIIVGIVLVVCLGGGVAGTLFFFKSKHAAEETGKESGTHGESKAEGEHGGDAHGEKKDDGGHGEKPAEEGKEGHGEEKAELHVFDHVYTLPSLEIKMGDPEHEKTLKTDIHVEMDRPELALEFNDRKDMLLGALRSVIAAKTLTELEGAEGKIRLKMALIAELNNRLETGKVRNIYFTDFLIM